MDTTEHIKNIWDYMLMKHSLKKVDLILILGSQDISVAAHAAAMFHKGYASRVICTGGKGKITKNAFSKSEAETFKDILVQKKVPESVIYIENLSSNTGENILFAKELLEKEGIVVSSVMVVTKPYMERRAFATFKKIWKGVDVLMTSPDKMFDSYEVEDRDRLLNLMVGDLQRIKEYPALGFQIEQDIPADVWASWHALVEQGYDKYLLR